ncbi:MAG: hypothetical protein ACREMO_10885 [Gemmatimonadales bacterium]
MTHRASSWTRLRRLGGLCLAGAVGCGGDAVGPGAGSLQVAIATSGTLGDPNGYALEIDGVPAQSIGAGGTITILGLAAGDHTVRLSDLASNCTLQGANPRTVKVRAGSTAVASFQVDCAGPAAGELLITTISIGPLVDSSGYAISVDGGPPLPIGSNDVLVMPGLSTGVHRLQLSGLASFCRVGRNPRLITLGSSPFPIVLFRVKCQTRVTGVQ